MMMKKLKSMKNINEDNEKIKQREMRSEARSSVIFKTYRLSSRQKMINVVEMDALRSSKAQKETA